MSTGITNDLQVKRPKEVVERRIACFDAEPYSEKFTKFGKILEHIRTLQKAALYVIMKSKSESQSMIIQFPDPNTDDEVQPQIDDVIAEAEEALSQAFNYTKSEKLLLPFYVNLVIHGMAAKPWELFKKFKKEFF